MITSDDIDRKYKTLKNDGKNPRKFYNLKITET